MSHKVECSAIIFDLDGTLIDSGSAIHKLWEHYASENNVDINKIWEMCHGVRSIDIVKKYTPELANYQYLSKLEGQVPILYGQDAKPIPGAIEFVHKLDKFRHENSQRWAIVTSGTHALAEGWLKKMKFIPPSIFICAQDISRGKPDPQGYLLAKQTIFANNGNNNNDDSTGVVFEDADAGIRAAKAAGCLCVALLTTISLDQVLAAGADYVINDYHDVDILDNTADNNNNKQQQPLQLVIRDVRSRG